MLVTLLVTACIAPGRVIRDLPQQDWTTLYGDLQRAPHANERVPLRVSVAWNDGMGRGFPAAPVVMNDLLISTVSGGGILAASASSGDRHWGRRFNGSIAGQPLRVDERIFFVTQHRGSTVYALDLARGRRLWSRRLDGRATAEPAYVDGALFVATDRGELIALDAAAGDIVWRTRVGAQAFQAPLVAGDDIIVAARDTIVHVARRGGAIRAKHAVASSPTAPLALRGDTLTMVLQGGVVAAYTGFGAREIWRDSVGVPILAAPAVTPDGVYVLTRDVQLFRIVDGVREQIADLDGAATESLAIAANGALIGRLDGSMTFVDFSGRTLWQEKLTGSIRAPAVVAGSSIYVCTLAGRMVKLTG